MSFGTHYLYVDPGSHYILTDLQVEVCWNGWSVDLGQLEEQEEQGGLRGGQLRSLLGATWSPTRNGSIGKVEHN